MFKNKELEYVLTPYVEVGMFEPKSGTSSEMVVVSMGVREEQCLPDIKTFINYMPLKGLVDVTTTDYSNEDGEYTIFVELFLDENTWGDILRLVYEMGVVSGLDKWKMRMYKKKEKQITIDEIAECIKNA